MKELGALITNCSCLVADVKKVFNVYWDMGAENAVVPQSWPKNYSTEINNVNPVPVKFNGQFDMNAYFSVRLLLNEMIKKNIPNCSKSRSFRVHHHR